MQMQWEAGKERDEHSSGDVCMAIALINSITIYYHYYWGEDDTDYMKLIQHLVWQARDEALLPW